MSPPTRSTPEQRPKRQPANSSGIIIPQRPKWHGEVAASGLWLLGRVFSSSWRVIIDDESGLFSPDAKGPVIFAIWHNRLAVAMTMWEWVRRQRPEAGLAALISASRDGGLLARTFEHFGVTAVRGSSSRRGAQALVELIKALRSGYHVAITPDGPRGPRYSVQPGIVSLAQLTGAPIVPVFARIQRKKELRSWDQFQVPWPFTRCELGFCKPVYIPRDATEEAREQFRAELEKDLRRINRD